jgi:hypothetical protein
VLEPVGQEVDILAARHPGGPIGAIGEDLNRVLEVSLEFWTNITRFFDYVVDSGSRDTCTFIKTIHETSNGIIG